MKKRILSLILMMCLICITSVAFAKPQEISVSDGITFASNVYLEGKTEPGREVTFLLSNNSRTVYIEELTADIYGNYSIKFPIRENIDDCIFRIKDSETLSDITDSIKKVEATDNSISVTLKVKNSADGKKYIDSGDKLNVFSEVINKYCENSEFTLIMVAYDENGTLLGAETEKCSIGYEINQSLEADFSNFTIPDKTSFVKVYAFNNMKNLSPLGIPGSIGKSVNLHLLSHSQCASYTDYYYPRMGWGQFIGDMLSENVTVKNWARAGWSLKAFLVSGNNPVKGDLESCYQPENSVWNTTILPEIKSGDYVLISHGINDYFQSGYDIKNEGGEVIFSWKQTSSEFKESLKSVINDIRKKGAVPILSTDTSEVRETLYAQVYEYNNAIREVSEEESIAFIDILTPYRNEYLKTGLTEFRDTYNLTPATLNWYQKYDYVGGSYSNAINSTNDHAHYSKQGAELVAKIIAKELMKTDCPLKKFIVKY